MQLRISLLSRFVAVGVVSLLPGLAHAADHHPNPQAVLLNNAGVAMMNQQQTEKAEGEFAEAAKLDPSLEQAALNDGIALLALQKLPQAQATLERAATLDPADPRPWYNLGLVHRAANELEDALKAFEQASKIDPTDADSLYFQGVCLQDLKRLEPAVLVFQKALAQNPLHASSEFAMARALQRSGKAADAHPHFQRFQHLTGAKVAAALGLAYGEQGRYSMAVPYQATATARPTAIPVHFTLERVLPASLTPLEPLKTWAASPHTGGACILDVDGDGIPDLLLMGSGDQAIHVLRNKGTGSFEELPAEPLGLKLSGHGVSCAVGDIDADGLNDLAVATDDQLLLYKNLGKGHFENITEKAGIKHLNHAQGITFLDYDHDGDLDLLVTGSPLAEGGNATILWRNNGNKTFTEVTDATGLGGHGQTRAAILSDVNNDRAVDIVVTGDGPSPTVYINPREGKYPAVPLYGPESPAKLGTTLGVSVLDFNKDGWMDLAVTHDSAPGLTLWRNHEGKGFERVPLPMDGVKRAWGLTALDYDNDGWIDLAVLVETARGAAVRILRNRGDGSFEDVSHALGLDKIALASPRGLIGMDVDGDGAADLLITQATANPVWLKNHGGAANHSVRLRFTGFADNKTAIGAKIELVSADNWQKWELPGASGYLTQGPQEIVAGLGQTPFADMVRMLWPTGVPQDEVDVPHTAVVAYTEADRRGSSCPVLFAWDGHRYRLVTDTIGAAVVGHWFTPARRNIPRPEEWIKVDGDALAPVDGRLSLRFTEPMEEVNYIDQLRLVAVDHPAGTQVYPDERFLDDPPFPTGKLIVSAAARPVAAAWDDHGRDVSAALATADHNFVSDFTKAPYDGFANTHALTLDLGPIQPANPLRLLLTGYVEYFSASSLYGAWQAGIAPISPYVEAQLPDGSWQRLGKEMGFPAGLQRTIVVDLTGKLPAGSQRVRIVSNLQIYWDQVLVDNGPDSTASARQTEVPMDRATMRFHGYPRQIDGVSPGDLNYNYDEVSLTGPFQRQRGNYTRFGDVTPLVSGVDNRFAIFGSGEEIGTEFDARALPTLPTGYTRDYFFYANGYVKDMDYYDASPFTVSQLPFHGMSAYPYPASESYPEDDQALDYQLNWNDRYDQGQPNHSFRFNYQPRPSTPADTAPPTAPPAPAGGTGASR